MNTESHLPDWKKDGLNSVSVQQFNYMIRACNAYSELLATCKSLLGFVEMKLAHTGTQSVEQILTELEHVRQISHVSTGHHLGCSKTTRTVDLEKVRNLIERCEAANLNQFAISTVIPKP